MNVSAGGRKLVGAAEAERPLADLEVFDAADKRRAAVELFGGDASRGSGLAVTHAGRNAAVGLGPDGKPLR